MEPLAKKVSWKTACAMAAPTLPCEGDMASALTCQHGADCLAGRSITDGRKRDARSPKAVPEEVRVSHNSLEDRLLISPLPFIVSARSEGLRSPPRAGRVNLALVLRLALEGLARFLRDDLEAQAEREERDAEVLLPAELL